MGKGSFWVQVAVDDLQRYEYRKIALDNLTTKINVLEAQFTAIRAARTDGEPVSGSKGNHREDVMLNNITMRDKLKAQYRNTKADVVRTERALQALDDAEKRILELFYIRRPYDHIGVLMSEMNIDRSEVYRRKDTAITKFTIASYGGTDT